jgi:DNA-binding response OmpR family regulator
MSQNKLLIIDDDKGLGEVLEEYLIKFGHQVHFCADPDQGIDQLKQSYFDLLILDIMMPKKDGFQVCREIRQFSQIPIIFLSARGETTDKIVGLEIGADDYLAKPFEPRELIARIDSVLRRVDRRPIQQKGLEIQPGAMKVFLNEKDLHLTAMEFKAFYYLYKNQAKVVRREDLINHLQGMDIEVFDRSVDILISRLRQKLSDDVKNPKYIKTIRGEGYRFIGELK